MDVNGTHNGVTRHHPNGGGGNFFDEQLVSQKIVSWQRSGDVQELNTIITLCRPSILSLAHSQNTTQYESEDELLSRCNHKLFKGLHRWNPERGSAFSMVRWLCQGALINAVRENRKQAARFTPMEPSALNELPGHTADESPTEFLEVIRHATSQIRSSVTDPDEREAQRWMLASLRDAEFNLHRHQVADTGKEFGLTHARSRQLYDITVLSLRRILYADVWADKRVTHISERDRPMLRFKSFCSDKEMVKLLCLLRNLGWVWLIKSQRPANIGAIERLNDPARIRESLVLTLEGSPDATLLYHT